MEVKPLKTRWGNLKCSKCGGEVTFTLHDGAIEVLDSSCVCAWAGSDEFNASAREALICPATPLRATKRPESRLSAS